MNLEGINKNKIIFGVIGAVLLLFIIIFVYSLQKGGQEQQTRDRGEFTIWTLYDDNSKFNSFVNTFKQEYPKYDSKDIEVISFNNYNDYFYSLIGSFLRGNSPDLFVLNNSDSGFFDEQLIGVNPQVVSPSYFRNNFELVFQNDLIKRQNMGDGETVEYLKGLPIGYEKLGLFYNFRELRGSDLSTWGGVNQAISNLRNKGDIGLGIGNGSTVYGVSDIIKGFLAQDGINSIERLSQTDLRNTFSRYFMFGEAQGDNRYNTEFNRMTNSGLDNLDLFSRGDLQMVIGYPRMINEIDNRGFNSNFLRAGVFPQQSANSGKTLIDYNYFVINKDTRDLDMSLDFMKYVSSEKGQREYLSIFKNYMPSLLSLVSDRLSENIHDGYNITHESFYKSSIDMVSLNTPLKSIFDKEIKFVLDNPLNYQNDFENLRKRLVCLKDQMINGSNLGVNCK